MHIPGVTVPVTVKKEGALPLDPQAKLTAAA